MEHPVETPAPLSAPTTTLQARARALGVVWTSVAALAAVVTAFLLHQLMAWPPHEDESLALLVGRDSLGGVISHVTRDRGGAPLHFLVAWIVAHAGFGLGALRLVSAAFAIGSLPLIALLGLRLADRRVAVLATAVGATSWILLFHGVYGRMYSLFLFLTLCSYLAFLAALDGRDSRRWLLWLAMTLLAVATHPYGALVVGSQALAVVLLRREQIRYSLRWFATLAVTGIPFWLTDIVLAGRFEVGVGGGGQKLGGPTAILDYLYRSAGDMTAGWRWLLSPILLVAAVGVAVAPRDARRMALAVGAFPVVAFLIARLGNSASPESRHLIFVMPFFAICVVSGLLWLARDRLPVVVAAIAGLMVAQVAWTWHKTAALFEWEPTIRQEARKEASAYLAATSRPDDLLLGYDPLYLQAWERNRSFATTVLPRADGALTLRILRRTEKPLGRGVWVLDRSDNSNLDTDLFIGRHFPLPPDAFVARNFGPFLVIRTRRPVETIDAYLFYAGQAMLLGRALDIADASINRATIQRARRLYDESIWGPLDAPASDSSP